MKKKLIRLLGLRGSWKWAKKRMVEHGDIIKSASWNGTLKIAVDSKENQLLLATWDNLDHKPEWEVCPYHLQMEGRVDYFVTANINLSYGGIDMNRRKMLLA